MIRPTLFHAIGGLDENYFLYYEETDFCWRAKQAGFDTWYVAESRVMHIGGQSTSVSHCSVTPKRFPAYWFESRRRFFVKSFGMAHTIMIDIATVLAHSLGAIKRVLQLQRYLLVPNYIGDLMRFSVLWRKNRKIPALKSRIAPGRDVGDGDY
jgi:N-acetylglucosaminyl-diphospho-decaprenol L-rhamnosyltransferase